MHQISSRAVVEPFLPGLFAYCPTMDLVATVTKKDSIDVWRLNGHRVFGASFAKDEDEDEGGGGAAKSEGQGEGNVKGLAWRSDGESWYFLFQLSFLSWRWSCAAQLACIRCLDLPLLCVIDESSGGDKLTRIHMDRPNSCSCLLRRHPLTHQRLHRQDRTPNIYAHYAAPLLDTCVPTIPVPVTNTNTQAKFQILAPAFAPTNSLGTLVDNTLRLSLTRHNPRSIIIPRFVRQRLTRPAPFPPRRRG